MNHMCHHEWSHVVPSSAHGSMQCQCHCLCHCHSVSLTSNVSRYCQCHCHYLDLSFPFPLLRSMPEARPVLWICTIATSSVLTRRFSRIIFIHFLSGSRRRRQIARNFPAVWQPRPCQYLTDCISTTRVSNCAGPGNNLPRLVELWTLFMRTVRQSTVDSRLQSFAIARYILPFFYL